MIVIRCAFEVELGRIDSEMARKLFLLNLWDNKLFFSPKIKISRNKKYRGELYERG